MQAGSSSSTISHNATFPIPKDTLTAGRLNRIVRRTKSFCIGAPDRSISLALSLDATNTAQFAFERGARYADWLREGVIAKIPCHLKRIDRLPHITDCSTLQVAALL